MPATSPRSRPAVILVPDRTLSADYRVLFDGIFATTQTTHVPEWAMRRFVWPALATDDLGRAAAAPLGLRRVESALLAWSPLSRDEVVCTTPDRLPALLGEWVKVVAVSSSDPLGRGMMNTTTSSFWPGRLYTRVVTERMMGALARAKDRCGFRVIAGGAGAWQWAQEPDEARRQGIDVVYEGYFEGAGPALVTDILAGRDVPAGVRSRDTAVGRVRPIRGPSVLGVIEFSRGCGNGCRFCAMAGEPMAHLPVETILADVQTNLAAGRRWLVSGSEDFFRYGGAGWKVNFGALGDLLAAIRRMPGLQLMQIGHANVSSVLQFSRDELREVRRLLRLPGRCEYLWVNLGAESGSPRLIRAHARGKVAPFAAEDWPELVIESADRLVGGGFFPIFSVILGLPGETADDVAATLGMVRRLEKMRAAVFPIFYEPVDAGEGARAGFGLDRMREDHLDLYTACYEINFRWMPRLFWDNQRAGGVGWARRLLMQAVGRAEVRSWRRGFARVRERIAARPAAEAAPTAPAPSQAGKRQGGLGYV